MEDELQPLRDEGFLIGRAKGGVLRAHGKPHVINRMSTSNMLRRERMKIDAACGAAYLILGSGTVDTPAVRSQSSM